MFSGRRHGEGRTDSGQIYIPIKPNLAILIARDPSVVRPRKQDVLNYENKLDTFAVIKSSWVKVFNSLVVKSSENVVIHNAKAEWLEKLVRKYRNWRMEAIVEHFPTERGAVTVTRLRPREMPRQKINGSKDNS